MQKLDSLRQKLFLDDHHKMERFCITFVAFIVILFALFGVAVKKHSDMQKLSLSTTALYTRNSKWSLTGESIEFLNLYRNEDFTKAFILLRVADMTNLSLDANDYTILMTASNKTEITCNPKASIYVFGSTGYMGLYFADAAGFNPAFYDIAIRNDKMVGVHSNPNAAAEFGSAAFSQFNMTRLYANLRGEDGVVADFLSQEQPSVEGIYKELVAAQIFDSKKAEVDDTIRAMNDCMLAIQSNAERLSTLNIVVPELPDIIRGDKIVTDESLTESNASEFSVTMLDQVDSLISADYNMTDGTDSVEGIQNIPDDSNLYYVTDTVYPGGLQFNHQNVIITDNISNTFVPDGYEFRSWAVDKLAEPNNYAFPAYLRRSEGKATWYYKDGTAFVAQASDAFVNTEEATIIDLINKYDDAVWELCRLKSVYQKNELYSLIKIDAESNDIADLVSVHSGDDILIRY